MRYHISQTPKLGLQIVRPYIFKDYRGEYTETYNAQDVFPGISFCQDSIIRSTKCVLRGYHGDDRTHKLISCLYGAFQITVVCIDPQDSEFMKSETMILDDKEKLMLLVPPKFINAHQCLTDDCLFFYKQDTYYLGQQHQYTIRWDSIQGVQWPYHPTLSRRDAIDAKLVFNYIKDNILLKPEDVNLKKEGLNVQNMV